MAPTITVPVSFASCSIGLPRHSLQQKLRAISSAGFQGIELSFPDLVSFAKGHFSKDIADDDYPTLCEAGGEVRKLTEQLGLRIIVLQPFSNFEGWPEYSEERQEAFDRAKGWMEIMSAVGTDMLQVGSSDSPGITSSVSRLAQDLADLADLLATRRFSLAYENWCWSTHAPTWKHVWTIVKEANRPNIGLCLDTFQSAASWGDPTTESGRVETAGISEEDLMMSYRISLDELATTVPPEKIYFLQISDAYRVSPPLEATTDQSGLRPKGQWSHDHRPLPYDGGYLPIAEFVGAVLATGFRNWFSMEVFDGHFEEKYGDDLAGFATKAMEAHTRLLDEAFTGEALQHGDHQT